MADRDGAISFMDDVYGHSVWVGEGDGRVHVDVLLPGGPTGNSNPEGCNQYTGPGCEGASKDDLYREVEPNRVASARLKEILSSPHADAILSEIPTGSRLLGAGREALVLRKPNGDVVRVSKNQSRPNVPEVLQAKSESRHGDHLVEHLPFAEDVGSQDTSVWGHIAKLDKGLRERGYTNRDIGPENVGRVGDRWVFLDPGEITSNAVPLDAEEAGGRWVTTDEGRHLWLSDEGSLHVSPGGEQVTDGKGKKGHAPSTPTGKGALHGKWNAEGEREDGGEAIEADIRKEVSPEELAKDISKSTLLHVTDEAGAEHINRTGFRQSRSDQNAFGAGVYLSSSESDIGNTIVGMGGEKTAVVKATAAVKKTWEVKDLHHWQEEAIRHAGGKVEGDGTLSYGGVTIKGDDSSLRAMAARRDMVQRALKDNGYDSMIVRPEGPARRYFLGGHQVVVFDNSAAKLVHNAATANAVDLDADEQVRQEGDWDCGAAAAMSVARHFGVGPDSLEDWSDLLGVKEGLHGRSALPARIVSTLRGLGLDARPLHGLTVDHLADLTDEGTPVLCPIQHLPGDDEDAPKDHHGHWVVVLGVEDAPTGNSNPEGCNQHTGPGCGVGPVPRQSPPTSKREAETRFKETSRGLPGGRESYAGPDKRLFSLPGGRWIAASLKNYWGEEGENLKGHAVRLDFGIEGQGTKYSGKELQSGTIDLMRTLERMAKAYHAAGFKLEVGAADEQRARIYDRALRRMGFTKEDAKEAGATSPNVTVWNLAESSRRVTFHDPDAALGLISLPEQEWDAVWHDVGEDGAKYVRFGIAVSQGTPTDNCNPGQMRGADGRCGPGISEGLSRDEMPQVKGEDLDHFLGWAAAQGHSPERREVAARDLSPVQREFRQERVDALPEEALEQPVLVSQDLKILDGTHRWVRHWQRDRESPVPVLVLPLAFNDALDLMHRYPRSKVTANALGDLVANLASEGWSVDDVQDAIAAALDPGHVLNFDPNQARAPDGKWTAGAGGAGVATSSHRGLFGRLVDRVKGALMGAGREDVRVEGQRDFSHPHESKAVQDILSGRAQHDLHAGLPSSKEDTALTAIMKEAGRAGKPRLASSQEIDELGKKGWYVAYRGTGEAKHAEQFRTGEEMYNGAGTYGNGSYFTYGGRARSDQQAREGAQMYAAQNSQDGKGAVTRIAFPPGAKIADHESLNKERVTYLKGLNDKLFSGKMSKEDHAREYALHEDMGRFAAMRNYDAIRVPHEGFLVVLNRNKVVAQRD